MTAHAAVHHHQPVPAIVRTVDQLGWPHVPTRAEQYAVARLMLRTYVRGRGAVACRLRVPFGRGFCTVTRITPRAARSFRVNWRFYEDGSGVSWRNLH